METRQAQDPEAGVYDDWRWHFEGRFPVGRAPEQAYVHIAAFVDWLAMRGMIEPGRRRGGSELSAAVERVRDRSVPMTSLRDATEGRLAESFLTSEGRAFATAYYAPEYGYARDWQRTFGRQADLYEVPDSWETYSRMERVIDRRYRQWIAAARPEFMPLPGLSGLLARLLDRRRRPR